MQAFNRKIKISFVVVFSILLSSIILQANAADTDIAVPTPQANTSLLIPSPPKLDAKGYVLIDANSGYVIAEKNQDQRMPPASLTKLMTLYIIANALHNGQITLDDQVRISKEAWQMGGSKMFVKVGSNVPVKYLIQGIIVASGNDATVAMAEYVGGNTTSFIDLMNQTAANLGMAGTNYADTNGLPTPNHYSTPGDIARLARAWILDFPEYYPWFKQKWITYNKIRQPNRNRLLWRDASVDGMKTGHTNAAGYCLVASAQRNGMRLISVVMGTPTDSARANGSETLLNYGFRFYETHKLYTADTPLMTPRVWLGRNKKAALGLARDLYVTIPKGQYKGVKITVSMNNKNLHAPVVKGQVYGTVTVSLNDKVVAQQPLVALQDDPTGGFWRHLIDYIELFFHKIF